MHPHAKMKRFNPEILLALKFFQPFATRLMCYQCVHECEEVLWGKSKPAYHNDLQITMFDTILHGVNLAI